MRYYIFAALLFILHPDALLATPSPKDACISPLPTVRTLSFYHLHTNERATITYYRHGYNTKGLKEVSHFLRDFRTGQEHLIDPQLLDILLILKCQESANYYGKDY